MSVNTINKKYALYKSSLSLEVQMTNLRSDSVIFNSLSPGLSWPELLSNFKNSLSRLEYGDGEDWESIEHMNLKQLTSTKLDGRLTFLPDMLKYQLSELVLLHSSKSHFNQIFSIFLNACSGRIPTVETFKTTFKQLTIQIKQSLDRMDFDWTCLVDIDLLAGYNLRHPLTTEQKSLKIMEWAKGDKIRDNKLKDYYLLYTEAIQTRLLSTLGNLNLKFLSLREFITNTPLWMTDGSSRGLTIDVVDKLSNDKLKSRRKKQVIPLLYSLDELANMCLNFDSNIETYSVSEKIEPGKKYRCIISCHFVENIRLAYVEYCLGNLFKLAWPDVYFIQSQNSQMKMMTKMLNLTASNMINKQYLFFPLDASAFDQEVSSQEIKQIFRSIESFIEQQNLQLHEDCIEVLKIAGYAWFNMLIIIDKIVNLGKWEHGVPSGIRWTALVDSLVNATRFDVCKAALTRDANFGAPVVIDQMFQGDDMSIVLKRPIDTVRILEFYRSVNITIHPMKNFLSLKANEFLRKLYVGQEMRAYPNRMITKFLFRLPEKRGASNTHDLLTERVFTVYRLGNRSNNRLYFINKVKRFFSKLFDLKNWTDIFVVLTTITTQGGLGYILDKDQHTPRTNEIDVTVKWPNIEQLQHDSKDELDNIKLRGLYSEQLAYLEYKSNRALGTDNLQTSLKGSLDPQKRNLFIDRFIIREIKMLKFSPGISLKFHWSNLTAGEFRPFMINEKFKTASTNDLYVSLRKAGDVTFIIDNCDDTVKLLATKLSIKFERELFWDWVESKIDIFSFNYHLLCDLQRSSISKTIFSIYLSRFMNTRDKVTKMDLVKLNVLCFRHIKHTIVHAINNKFVPVMLD